MKLEGSITKQEDFGADIRVTVTNIKRVGQAEWREYSPELTFLVPPSRAKDYCVGRTVRLAVELK